MRLSRLKLSGFKSFVDSTTFYFKGNRTAVVGPNGCGKSNVIDAIRWVMGESSARQLRGGSMQDVIFSGTEKRKAVGLASVELKFDNTYGKLGGIYNAYTELAIRRQVTRDGKSEYFLNGTKCRRKDITDIFLGTGLGPRSYAVIEQGMISRLVDAKPDEMRVFIEEAAGVSRYQSRRKETLQHLEQAEQNLSRLQDIDHELEKQLKTLECQVKTALQYQQLEQEILCLKVEMLSYQIEQSLQHQHASQELLTQLSDEFKEIRIELNQVESAFQNGQASLQNLVDQSTPLQLKWQNAEKCLAELTAQLVQKRNLFEQTQQQIQALEQQQLQYHEQSQIYDLQIDQLQEQLDQKQQAILDQEQQNQQTLQQFQNLKQQQQQNQTEFSQYQQQLSQYQQQLQQLETQQQQLKKNNQRLLQQQQTILAQQKKIAQLDYHDSLLDYQQQQQEIIKQVKQTELQLKTQQQYDEIQQQQGQKLKQSRQEQQTEIHILQAEYHHLQKILVKESALSKKQSLISQLILEDFAKPHAALIEKVCASWLSADLLQENEPFDVDIARQIRPFDSLSRLVNEWHENLKIYPTLQTWIKQPIWQFLSNVVIIEQYEKALHLQPLLQAHQQILTLDGFLLGIDWQIALAYDISSNQMQGAFHSHIRAQEIEQTLTHLKNQLQDLDQEYHQYQLISKDHQQNLEQLQTIDQQLKAQQQQLALEIVKLQSQQEASVLQQQQLTEQYQQIEQQLADDLLQLDEWQIDYHALQIKLDDIQPHLQAKQIQLEDIEQQLQEVEKLLLTQQDDIQKQQKEAMQLKQEIELISKDSTFLEQQVQQYTTQYQHLQSTLLPLQLELPRLQAELDTQAQLTIELQEAWQVWQNNLNLAQQKQQNDIELRQKLQQQDESLRQKIEEQRLIWQSTQSDVKHYQEQLDNLHAERMQGLKIDLEQHQAKLATAQEKFDKIGAVNLIASQEYQEIKERYDELNHQINDVQHTVIQLHDAIKSIDQETKSLFMDTFNQINHELQLLFPKIFNGGEASLTLEDDWQSGIKLMARPPGKKNSSLALLSGGEKALTALALVFAIFRLNPAPFCILDEVDAPLDDANVQRFCHLVKELSEHVQFIYITHNKLAMAMATDLLGVTMPEAGASKLVAVNVEEAKEFGLMLE